LVKPHAYGTAAVFVCQNCFSWSAHTAKPGDLAHPTFWTHGTAAAFLCTRTKIDFLAQRTQLSLAALHTPTSTAHMRDSILHYVGGRICSAEPITATVTV
jgi:hypothetical protein